MNEKIKNYLGLTIIIAILVFAYASLKYVDYYSKSIQPSAFRSFSVSAEGKITAIPDVAQFTFSVITEGGKDITKLQKDNTEKINKAIEFLKANEIKTKDIKTQSYNLEPRYQYYRCPISRNGEVKPCPPPEIVGYTITQTVLVKIRNFEKIGDILSGVIQNGANSVSQLSFTIDDPTKIEDQARTEAIEKAKEKAKSVAKAGGFQLGRLLSIEEGGYYPTPRPLYALREAVGGAEAPTIEPGSQEVVVNITLKYEIE